ncbi:DEAD/DEAH box helicase [Candidatus Peregrinibacteria bacterium]|nr:MAG: DEAD/DEAH box helicase [Candidatus Peregrinibacteria bacterium]
MEIEEVISAIERQDSISIDESFSFAKITSVLLRIDEEKGRKIIIYILDNWVKLPKETYEIWTDLIESAGFYPYLEKEKEKLQFNNLAGEIRKGCHLSENLGDKYFHEQQKYLKSILDSGKNLIVSAPTSFGKSLLIEEIVASKKFKNIVVIQPTLALLDETRKKLKKYKEKYKIIVRTSQEYSEEKGNLFLLTAERVMEYKNLPIIDFFVIDEFYKLSAERDDERSDILNNSFYKLLQQDPVPKFYLLGPNIDNISCGFEEKYNAVFYKTNYSLIDNKTIDVYSGQKEKFDKPRKYKGYKENVLFEKLFELIDEQTIIYCSSPSRVRELSNNFCTFLETKNIQKKDSLPLIEWIKQNVSPQWNLIKCLEFEIGINDGALPKHINSSMIDYFNDKKLKYIFCTSTIIEGVNTSAKNVIFFDKTKGKKTLIDFFDYSNIKGRSGRMMVHYVGRVFNFNSPPKKKEEMIIDIPFHQQSPIKDEVLNGLKDEDIKPTTKETEQYKDLMKIPEDQRILFQKNGILIKGQKQILDIIIDLDKVYSVTTKAGNENYKIYDLLNWTYAPSYIQIKFLLELCWKNLMKKGESPKVKSLDQLVFLVSEYGRNGSILSLVQKNFNYSKNHNNQNKTDDELLNQSIEEIFNILRHWFQYKIPKWLSVMNELQKYACEKKGVTSGNYSVYAAKIENDFVRDNLTILSEYGIPTSAINKIASSLDKDLSEDEILKKVVEVSLASNELLQYEKDKIFNCL